MIPNAPGVQMQPVPDDGIAEESDDEDDKQNSADQRISSKIHVFYKKVFWPSIETFVTSS